jgi:LAO/AO transport system kinase
MKENKNIPEWNESNASGGFASKYSNGTVEKHVINPQKVTAPRLKQMSPEEYCSGILNGNRTALARAITLIESSSPKHVDIARRLLNLLLPHSGKSIRIGITGAPGGQEKGFYRFIRELSGKFKS